MWFDSHCHLHICEEDRPVDEVIAEARAAGVDRMLTVGFDEQSNPRAVSLSKEEGIFASVGIHPNSATGWSDTAATALEPFLSDPNVVAVVDVTGAGDALVAGLVYGIYKGYSLKVAAKFGLRAAALTISTKEAVRRDLREGLLKSRIEEEKEEGEAGKRGRLL